jgi:hypothetical protein
MLIGAPEIHSLTKTSGRGELMLLLECRTQQAYRSSLIANKIGRVLTEHIYMHKTKCEKDFLTKSAQERYAALIFTRPDILKLVPVNKIAKYLGVHPESLSRIRKSIIS